MGDFQLAASVRTRKSFALLAALGSAFSFAAHADPAPSVTQPDLSMTAPAHPILVAAGPAVPQQSDGFLASYFSNYAAMVAAAKASQPDWSSPLITTTSTLEQRFRFDAQYQSAGNTTSTLVLDGGKGVDFIVGPTTEIQLAFDPYDIRTSNLQKKESDSKKGEFSGFADWPLFRIKERLASSPSDEGNYVLSAWLQIQDAAGIKPLTNNALTLLPTIGFGKGWGKFDIQGTVGATIPTDHESKLGTQLSNNLAFQYHLGKLFWPQIESNLTYWTDGTRGRKTQLYLTPGIVVGRFQISKRLKFTTGIGYSVAVTPHYQSSPLIPAYNHAWVFTMRLSF
jgi:hypothetical protein